MKTQHVRSTASRAGTLVLLCLTLVASACGGNKASTKNGGDVARSKTLDGTTDGGGGASHCAASDPRHEVSEYDTSGDETLDVRKVFLRVGDGTLARLVLVCRESDLNSDGVKDIVRYYSDEGRPLREEADRNFDGQMDEITYFQEGQILRQEFDSTGDGKVDMKVFFEDGKPLRSERDLNGRSTAQKWQPDRWEYFEGGRMVRMGTDLDGDGKVDRWDRDMILRRPVDADSGAADGAADASG